MISRIKDGEGLTIVDTATAASREIAGPNFVVRISTLDAKVVHGNHFVRRGSVIDLEDTERIVAEIVTRAPAEASIATLSGNQ